MNPKNTNKPKPKLERRVTCRLPAEVIVRLEKLAARFATRLPGSEPILSRAMRASILVGLPLAEAEQAAFEAARKPTAKKKGGAR